MSLLTSISRKCRYFIFIGIAMLLLLLSSCAPFQVNLPGSCSIFSNPEVSPPQHEAPVDKAEKKKRGFFNK